MQDIIKDAFKLGLGVADISREQVERLVRKAQKRYGSQIKDGRKMTADLMRIAKQQSKKVQVRVEKEVNRAVKAQTIVEEKELRELKKRVGALASQTAKVASQASRRTVRKVKSHIKKRVAKRKAKRKTTRKRKTKRRAKRR